MHPQQFLAMLPIADVGPHQAFPQLAVVGDVEMQEFVHDHVVPDLRFQIQQLGIETQYAVG